MSLPLFNELINRAIGLDPDAPRALAELSGTRIAIHLDGVNLGFGLEVLGDRLQLAALGDEPADASITATPLALWQLLRSDDPAQALFSGAVQVHGRRDRVQRISAILQSLDIDWEEQLSGLVGDLLARQFGNRARAGRKWARDAAESARLDTREYLLDELRLLARPEHLRSFAAEIDGLRDDVDRLEARIRRLERERDEASSA